MTALCGGGTSAPKLGVTLTTAYGAAKVAQVLESYGAAWALEVVPLLVIPPILVSAFCATDPPSIPTFTSAEANALLQVQLGSDFVSGTAKMVQLIQHLAWYDLCDCTSGTLTALPAAPAAPSGTYVVSQPSAPSTSPCDAGQMFTSIGGGNVQLHISTAGSATGAATSVLMHFQITPTSGTGSIALRMQFRDQNNAQLSLSPTTTWTGGAFDQQAIFSVPANTVFYYLDVVTTGSLVGSLLLNVDIYCGYTNPTGTQDPCCPPDPTTQAQLNAILKLVTMLQRQLIPFGSIAGAAHSGLSAQGSFSIPRLLGIRIDLTTIPGNYGTSLDSPTYHFDMGWVSVSTPDGFIDERRITRSTQAWYPRIMTDATLVGYSFSPGVVATITEIEAEF